MDEDRGLTLATRKWQRIHDRKERHVFGGMFSLPLHRTESQGTGATLTRQRGNWLAQGHPVTVSLSHAHLARSIILRVAPAA